MAPSMQRSARSNERKGGFVYKKRSAEDVKAHSEQGAGNFDSMFTKSVKLFMAKNGENIIRFLPPTWGDHRHYGYEVYVHGFVGPNSDSYLCLKKMKNEACPICEAAQEAKEAGEDMDEVKKMEPKKRFFCYVLDRQGDDPLEPCVYNMSWTMDRDITALAIDPDDGSVLYLDHPDEGHDVIFKRKGQKLNTEYFGIRVKTKPSPIARHQKDQDDILEQIEETPIPKLLKYYPYEYLEDVMSGKKGASSRDRDLDEDEDVKPARRGAKGGRPSIKDDEDERPRGKRKPAPEDDEDDEPPVRNRRGSRADDDGDDEPPRRGKRKPVDEDEDEDEAPRRARKRGRAEPEEDEDDEPAPRRSSKRRPDPEEDEDDEPAPRRKGRRADPDDDEEDEEPAPRRGKRKPAEDEDDEEEVKPRGRSRKPADEDDEEDEPAPRKGRGRAPAKDDDDEEEDEKPARRRGRGSKDEDDEPPFDEDEESEDEEDEAPRGRGKPSGRRGSRR